MELIRFENVSKYYGNVRVLSEVNLSITAGETVILLGPSGCGKTTLLKLINGLITPEKGQLTFKGEATHQINPLELRRKIGYVIQDVGLFPHLTILENILIPLKVSGIKKNKKEVSDLLGLVGLEEDLKNRYPNELSGGQQQRVGIARALVSNPELILMDEPFSALDNITRSQLQDDFLRLDHLLEKTTVLVTHDVHEAFKLADRIVLLHEGAIQQTGTPLELLQSPANSFVADFLHKDQLMLELQHLQFHEPATTEPSSVLGALKDPAFSTEQKLEVIRKFLKTKEQK